MKIRVLVLLLVFCVGCTTYKDVNNKNLEGNFFGSSKGKIEGSNTQYNLELKKDNKFNLNIKGHDFNPECTGVWERKNDTLILKCSDIESIADKLSNGYMNQRKFLIRITNKNRLLLDKVVLKRN